MHNELARISVFIYFCILTRQPFEQTNETDVPGKISMSGNGRGAAKFSQIFPLLYFPPLLTRA